MSGKIREWEKAYSECYYRKTSSRNIITLNGTVFKVSYIRASVHQQKNTGYSQTHPCSLCLRWSRRIECKLTSCVCGRLLGVCGQGSMLPQHTRHNQGRRRYWTQKGSPDATRWDSRIVQVLSYNWLSSNNS